MTPDGSSYVLCEALLPRLVQVILQPDGATMSCYYCRRGARLQDGEVARQILHFQELHFDCDPAVATPVIFTR